MKGPSSDTQTPCLPIPPSSQRLPPRATQFLPQTLGCLELLLAITVGEAHGTQPQP